MFGAQQKRKRLSELCAELEAQADPPHTQAGVDVPGSPGSPGAERGRRARVAREQASGLIRKRFLLEEREGWRAEYGYLGGVSMPMPMPLSKSIEKRTSRGDGEREGNGGGQGEQAEAEEAERSSGQGEASERVRPLKPATPDTFLDSITAGRGVPVLSLDGEGREIQSYVRWNGYLAGPSGALFTSRSVSVHCSPHGEGYNKVRRPIVISRALCLWSITCPTTPTARGATGIQPTTSCVNSAYFGAKTCHTTSRRCFPPCVGNVIVNAITISPEGHEGGRGCHRGRRRGRR